MPTRKFLLPVLIAIMVMGCSSLPVGTPKAAITPTQEAIPTVEATQAVPQTETTNLNWLGVDTAGYFTPNLWTKINKDKITIYPYNRLSDFTYDRDGSLWMAGGFGVIHKTADGKQDWYSVKNGLPNNFFTTVAISPKGEVWVGGTNNALFRFDGKQWIDEGEKLPAPFDTATHWLCYSKDMYGIDFGPDGSAWVMNGGIEIYRQAYGEWVNIPFPKAVLPNAGGGGCPEGIRVRADNDITIKIGAITDQKVPSGITFDGQTWKFSYNANFEAVDELLAARRLPRDTQPAPVIGAIQWSADWPFDNEVLLDKVLAFYGRPPTQITVDKNGLIWLKGPFSGQLFNNEKGAFQDAGFHLAKTGDAALTTSDVLGFGTDVILHAPGKSWRIGDFGVFSTSYSIDNQDRVWAYDSSRVRSDDACCAKYSPGKGLVMFDHGDISSLGSVPDYFFDRNAGGVIHLSDQRTWVGGAGMIWEFQNGQWRELVVSESDQVLTDQVFTQFTEDNHGVVYGATDTTVYKFVGNDYTKTALVRQLSKPIVVSQDGKPSDCSFHIRYIVAADCPNRSLAYLMDSADALRQYDAAYNYKSRLLSVQADGSVIYINSHLIAKFENGHWKSFLFDTFSIDSATVDHDGNIWVLSGSDGLFRLASDIFDDYQGLIRP